ncbi:general secretion pathway protein C [Litorivivens lipolytica]|uniref:General secretion pathway protein C n=1 Tax=Litorivivens lipolytica TaxID=1524264 RepID=A0A7W4Z7I6_9GAMM|nr:type II secretion system protein GspC [Litorivivens lipolytica]MBB3048065.1 general secretion pathway protein C [Litorivivens lipolytica]
MQTVQRYIPLASTLLFALAGWLAALVIWELVLLFTPAKVDQSAAAPVAVSAPEPAAYDLNALLAVPLFGEATQTAVAAPLTEDVKRSNLRITLMGVVAGGETGVAILKHDGREHAYKVGDQLDVRETITLAAVAPEYVIISRASGNEKIELEKLRQRSGRDDIRVVQRSSTNSKTVNLNDPSIRRLVGDPRQTLNSNPLRLTRYISAQPYVENGKTVGFRVQAGRDKRLFGQLGLEAGDVVTAINGLRVGEAPVSDLLNSVNNSQSVEVEIRRNGQQQTIRLNL